jgi:hypothetical protein
MGLEMLERFMDRQPGGDHYSELMIQFRALIQLPGSDDQWHGPRPNSSEADG